MCVFIYIVGCSIHLYEYLTITWHSVTQDSVALAGITVEA